MTSGPADNSVFARANGDFKILSPNVQVVAIGARDGDQIGFSHQIGTHSKPNLPVEQKPISPFLRHRVAHEDGLLSLFAPPQTPASVAQKVGVLIVYGDHAPQMGDHVRH